MSVCTYVSKGGGCHLVLLFGECTGVPYQRCGNLADVAWANSGRGSWNLCEHSPVPVVVTRFGSSRGYPHWADVVGLRAKHETEASEHSRSAAGAALVCGGRLSVRLAQHRVWTPIRVSFEV